MSVRTNRLSVVVSGDFLRADGSPAFPEFDFGPLQRDPRIAFRFLPTSEAISPDQIAGADALVLSGARVTAESFHGNGRLALIAQFGAGFNHIDLDAATKNAVAVTNTPNGVRRPVAVSILTLIFALTTKLVVKAALTGKGIEGWSTAGTRTGVGLTGKTLGSIGLGNIGAEMFRLAQPLSMTFIAFDPYAPAVTAKQLGIELVTIDALFRRSDILCVNCPLTPETRQIVSAARLALMKPTAYLINTSRGGTVDQKALTEALVARRIAGAGLDVFEREPPDPADPIFRLDNVILTPHALCWTDELYAGCGRDAVQSVLTLLSGRTPPHIVNPGVAAIPAWQQKVAQFAQPTNEAIASDASRERRTDPRCD
jgi:D-3-phosphoglycerate dehydrogenase